MVKNRLPYDKVSRRWLVDRHSWSTNWKIPAIQSYTHLLTHSISFSYRELLHVSSQRISDASFYRPDTAPPVIQTTVSMVMEIKATTPTSKYYTNHPSSTSILRGPSYRQGLHPIRQLSKVCPCTSIKWHCLITGYLCKHSSCMLLPDSESANAIICTQFRMHTVTNNDNKLKQKLHK